MFQNSPLTKFCFILILTIILAACGESKQLVCEPISNGEHSYDTSKVDVLLKTANPEMYEYLEDRGGFANYGIELNYDGVYNECGDGSAYCQSPRNACCVIVTASANIQKLGDITVYKSPTFIFLYSDKPVAKSFSHIKAVKTEGITKFEFGEEIKIDWTNKTD